MQDVTTLGTMANESEYVELTFVSRFRTQYLRNNRGQGRKNLRCFPICSSKAHVERGFCGNSLTVLANGSNITSEDRVFLQVVPKASIHHLEKPSKNGPVSFPAPNCYEEMEVKIRLNELYLGTSLTQYTEHVYDNDYLCPRRLYIANLEIGKNSKASTDGNGRLKFVSNPKSWSYAWTSNKHTHMQTHVVRAYFMKFLGFNEERVRIYKCLGVSDSDPFQVSSSKGAQLSRILNRRNKKFLSAARAMQKSYNKVKKKNGGAISTKFSSDKGKSKLSAAESNAVATESLLALTRGLSEFESSSTTSSGSHGNKYAGIPDMNNKEIVMNRNRWKRRKADSNAGKRRPKKRTKKLATPKVKKEASEYEALRVLTDAIRSFNPEKSQSNLSNNRGIHNPNLGMQMQMHTTGMSQVNGISMNGMNGMINNPALRLMHVPGFGRMVQPMGLGMPGVPHQTLQAGYMAGLAQAQAMAPNAASYSGAFIGLNPIDIHHQHQTLHAQAIVDQQQTLQAQAFVDQRNRSLQHQNPGRFANVHPHVRNSALSPANILVGGKKGRD